MADVPDPVSNGFGVQIEEFTGQVARRKEQWFPKPKGLCAMAPDVELHRKAATTTCLSAEGLFPFA